MSGPVEIWQSLTELFGFLPGLLPFAFVGGAVLSAIAIWLTGKRGV